MPSNRKSNIKHQTSARTLALDTLRAVRAGAFADVALERTLRGVELSSAERRLLTELVYGAVRRQRTLDVLMEQFTGRRPSQQPPDLRLLLHLGLYQLRWLRLPPAAVVHETVEGARAAGLGGLARVVNGVLRGYLRAAEGGDPLRLPTDAVARIGTLHSYPDWIVRVWAEQVGLEEAEALAARLNDPPPLDLRVNALRATPDTVAHALGGAGLQAEPVASVAGALRLTGSTGPVPGLPGYTEGWWSVQDAAAQLVTVLLDPQQGETVVDACAAPGGKSTHVAERMGDHGTVWACDRTASRLRRLQENVARLGLRSVRLREGDSRTAPEFRGQADRVLLDVPCSGLGTLHRHPDARWRQTPESVAELAELQRELLNEAATWLKPGGTLVYATCTLHPDENERQLERFLATHPGWHLAPPSPGTPAAPFVTADGWIKVWPHRHAMDGFFMARLAHSASQTP